ILLPQADPVPNGLRALPIFYACTVGINLFSIMYTGAPLLGFDKLPLWGILLISAGSAVVCALVVWFFVCPRMKKKIERILSFGYSLSCSANPESLGHISSSWTLCVPNPQQHQKAAPWDPKIPLEVAVVLPSGVWQLISEQRDLSLNRSGRRAILNNLISLFNIEEKETTCLLTGAVRLPNGNLVQFNQAVGHQMSSSGQYQYHTVHKDSGLYKELLHKLHLAKMGDCMGDSGDKPLRRNNSYTSYTMAICGMPLDSLRAKEGEEMEKLTWPVADTKKRVRMDSHTSYCNADKPEVSLLFQFLQILTACFGSFAHGGNDVSNAIGPLVALYLVYQTGDVATKVATPIWLLLYGGAGICIGLWVWGRRVIQTMGKDLTPITPS
ncbi:Sodium-dependent phosphate transporter 1, partial [Gavia stellata]